MAKSCRKCSNVPCEKNLIKHHENCLPISSPCNGENHFIFGTLLDENTLLWSISNDCPECTLHFTVIYTDGTTSYTDSIPGGSSLVNLVNNVRSIQINCTGDQSDFCRGRFDYELTYIVKL